MDRPVRDKRQGRHGTTREAGRSHGEDDGLGHVSKAVGAVVKGFEQAGHGGDFRKVSGACPFLRRFQAFRELG